MPEPFEIQTELDEGFAWSRDGGDVRAWRGVRVKYRAVGSRGRWSKFLLEYGAQHEQGPSQPGSGA